VNATWLSAETMTCTDCINLLPRSMLSCCTPCARCAGLDVSRVLVPALCWEKQCIQDVARSWSEAICDTPAPLCMFTGRGCAARALSHRSFLPGPHGIVHVLGRLQHWPAGAGAGPRAAALGGWCEGVVDGFGPPRFAPLGHWASPVTRR
jgi:hypothetical protein